jgi:predicted RNA-binding protein YlxR (DUF448 family)
LNTEGKLIKVLPYSEEEVIIDLTNYSRGMYLIEANCKEGVFVKKIIKQ